jgi:hypothetical protein
MRYTELINEEFLATLNMAENLPLINNLERPERPSSTISTYSVEGITMQDLSKRFGPIQKCNVLEKQKLKILINELLQNKLSPFRNLDTFLNEFNSLLHNIYFPKHQNECLCIIQKINHWQKYPELCAQYIISLALCRWIPQSDEENILREWTLFYYDEIFKQCQSLPSFTGFVQMVAKWLKVPPHATGLLKCFSNTIPPATPLHSPILMETTTTTIIPSASAFDPYTQQNNLSNYIPNGPDKLAYQTQQGVKCHYPQTTPVVSIGKHIPIAIKTGKGSKLYSQRKQNDCETEEEDEDEEEEEMEADEEADETEEERGTTKRKENIQDTASKNKKQKTNVEIKLKWGDSIKLITISLEEEDQFIDLEQLFEHLPNYNQKIEQILTLLTKQTHQPHPPVYSPITNSPPASPTRHESPKLTSNTIVTNSQFASTQFSNILMACLLNINNFKKLLKNLILSTDADSMYLHYQQHALKPENFHIDFKLLEDNTKYRESLKTAFKLRYDAILRTYKPELTKDQFAKVFQEMHIKKLLYLNTYPKETPNNITVNQKIFDSVKNRFDYFILFHIIANSSATLIERYKLLVDVVLERKDVSTIHLFGDVMLAHYEMQRTEILSENGWITECSKDM